MDKSKRDKIDYIMSIALYNVSDNIHCWSDYKRSGVGFWNSNNVWYTGYWSLFFRYSNDEDKIYDYVEINDLNDLLSDWYKDIKDWDLDSKTDLMKMRFITSSVKLQLKQKIDICVSVVRWLQDGSYIDTLKPVAILVKEYVYKLESINNKVNEIFNLICDKLGE